jgi:hypothetical protein
MSGLGCVLCKTAPVERRLFRLSSCQSLSVAQGSGQLVLERTCVARSKAVGRRRSMELSEVDLGSSFLSRALCLSKKAILSRG